MTESLKFTKMHGLGNDFVVINCLSGTCAHDLPALATKLCDRHFGIGADGLLVIMPSDTADVRMRIFNADGSEARMCGNGIRCIAKYIYENHIIRSLNPVVETESGLKKLAIQLDGNDEVISVCVNMGNATLRTDSLVHKLNTDYGDFDIVPVSTGNQHGVVFVDNLKDIDIDILGPALENHPFWADKANIEFVEVISDHKLDQLTWERGVGETLACGTGACAAAVAAVATKRCSWPVEIRLAGGVLTIDREDETGNILLTGPAQTVFNGTIN